MAGRTQANVIHLNCGLHDLRINSGESTHQIPIETFQANLEQIFATLRSAAPDLRLIWATITPVMDDRHQATRSSRRYNADVVKYNSVGRSIAKRDGLQINDLYAFVTQQEFKSMLGGDGINSMPNGYKLLAKKPAASIRES